MENTNLPQKRETAEQKRLRLVTSLVKLQRATSASFSEAQMAIYCEQLDEFSAEAIEAGINRAIAVWEKPAMPPIGFIRARIADHFADVQRRQVEEHTKTILRRPDKPEDDDFSTDMTVRRAEARRIYLESKASCKWGPEAQKLATEQLRILDAGGTVPGIPENLGMAIREVAKQKGWNNPTWRN